jgi:hypothetical protein
MADKNDKKSSEDPAFKASNKDSLKANIIKDAIPQLAASAVSIILSLIPEGSTIDQILEKFQNYWGVVSGGILLTVQTYTKVPDIVTDAMADIRAEAIQQIKDRFKNGAVNKDTNSAKASTPPIGDIILMLRAVDYKKLVKLVSGKDTSSQVKFFNHSFVLKQAEAIKALTNLAQANQGDFDVWFDRRFPKTEPKDSLDVVKIITKTWNNIADNQGVKNTVSHISSYAAEVRGSYLEFLDKPTMIEKIGKKLDIFGITKN